MAAATYNRRNVESSIRAVYADQCSPSAKGVMLGSRLEPYCCSKLFQRFHASSRAFLLASVASGASPERMKPWAAPS